MPPKRKTALIPKQLRSEESDPVIHPLRHNGPLRPYYLTANEKYSSLSTQGLTKLDLFSIVGLFLFALSLRIVKLGDLKYPINAEEKSFINAINRYAKARHYNDSVPPLGKIWGFVVAKLLGVGLTLNDISLYPFRFVNVLLSSITVGVFYGILRKSGVSLILSNFSCLLFTLENLFALESRLVSSGSLQSFFLSILVSQLINLQTQQEMSCRWIKSLIFIGATLGLSLANDWNAVYTFVWLSFVFFLRLIAVSQDLSISTNSIIKQNLIKFQALILIPLVVYLSTFVIHLSMTPLFHLESSLLSTGFQRSKEGHPTGNTSIPQYVPFGSTVTLVHEDSLGGYLHSHLYNYKTGSLGQQVTVFDYMDYNNEWVIESGKKMFMNKFEPRIRDRSVVKLRHKLTGKLLSVNANKKPPISEQEYDFEVSCVGNKTYDGSEAEEFKISFLSSEDKSPDAQFLQTGKTRFALFNSKANCAILSHDMKLPEWGFGQQEVICIKEPNPARHVFYVEDVKYEAHHKKDAKLQNVTLTESYPLTKKVWELNKMVMRLRARLQEITKINSTGLSWIFNQTTYLMGINPDKNSIHYVMGNSFNFNIIIVSLIISTLLLIKNFIFPGTNLTLESNLLKIQTILLGYLVHMLLRPESSTLTDYKSSLFFGYILFALVAQNFFLRLSKKKQEIWLYAVVGLIIVCSYVKYQQLSYLSLGLKWTKKECLELVETGVLNDEAVCRHLD